jgi:uncharacterized protein with GYD domain
VVKVLGGSGRKEEMANMPYYLVQPSYTKEAVKTLVENPRTFRGGESAFEELGAASAKPTWPLETTTSFSS